VESFFEIWLSRRNDASPIAQDEQAYVVKFKLDLIPFLELFLAPNILNLITFFAPRPSLLKKRKKIPI
jgi:hypothetical protein